MLGLTTAAPLSGTCSSPERALEWAMGHQIDRHLMLHDRGNKGNPFLLTLVCGGRRWVLAMVTHLSRSCSLVRAISSGVPVIVKAPTGVVSIGGALGAAGLARVVVHRWGGDGAEAWLGGRGKVVVGEMGGFFYLGRVLAHMVKHPESIPQPNRGFLKSSLRIRFNFQIGYWCELPMTLEIKR
jgi:hypothetical protein